ncbi:SusD/RagB family nutrient-binding outer membrane lipoprotein [Pararhodonellum marinum]|uniref:SusD/RagB family nutrient-binding outer membrane lipoprotein n=1 Tax=Pararhodonellum marinum TaxID=2755358 RepID=UPI001890AEB3|nr:SusD/RagB family nutrient-binding outer membrane lipoprotein [Pararhodonellum marinum]
MKKYCKRILVLLGFAMLIQGCDQNLEEINLDPNRPSEVFPGVILDQLQYRLVNSSIGRARGFTHELMQMMAPRVSVNNGLHRYVIEPNNSEGFWNNHYRLMTDLMDMYTIAENLESPAYMGVALVLRSWSYSIMTDAFGDIPFTEASRIQEGVVQPAFDSQKDIYVQLLLDLEEANVLLSNASTFIFGGDLIYETNGPEGILKWRKFCNSLRLRLLLRILQKDGEVNVSQQISSILGNPGRYPLMNSNEDDAILTYPGTFPFYNPYFNLRDLSWNEGVYYTEYFIDQMNRTEDPRRAVWAHTVTENGVEVYKGIQSGYVSEVEYPVGSHSSFPGEFRNFANMGVLMPYAELEFILAELNIRSFQTPKSAKAHYEDGILASMIQWGTTLPIGYLDHEDISYDEDAGFDQKLETIIQQKYFASFFTDYQAWFDKRRTGYPLLPRGEGIPAENQFPSRITYPNYLQALNPDNLEAAIARMGGDTQDTKVWWEK